MFHQPVDIETALRLRGERPDATVVNGCTDVSVARNHGMLHPREVIDLSRIASLKTIEHDGDNLLIGAGATFAQLGKCHLKALREAALSVAGPAIRNQGTIGGNLVTASPAGDGCVALLAMGGDVELASAARGSRWVDVRAFFLGYRKTELAGDELVTRVRVPYNPVTRWYKIGKRGAVNISLVCAAVARRTDGSFGLAYGCVGPIPLFAPKAERVLARGPLTDALIAEAADVVESEVAPIDDHRGSADYRRAMCRTLTTRLLADIAKNGDQGDADAFSAGAAA
ncbi:MAG: FAD binding domain-containing protein [Phycisphaerales bacterium]|nr:FAD binding domain-containing protein [Phycisphaerales bacterium]